MDLINGKKANLGEGENLRGFGTNDLSILGGGLLDERVSGAQRTHKARMEEAAAAEEEEAVVDELREL